MNDGDQTCRFLQVWMKPEKRGVKPQYRSKRFEKKDRHNKLLHLLGGTGKVPDWPNMSPASQIRLHQVTSL